MITSMILFSNYLLIILSQPMFLAIIFLCHLPLDILLSLLSVPLISLCSLHLPISLLSLQICLFSFSGESRESRERERDQREREQREEKTYMCLEVMTARTTTKNHLLTTPTRSTRGRSYSSFFFPLSSSRRCRRRCRDGGKVAEIRLQRIFWGNLFGPRLSKFGFF